MRNKTEPPAAGEAAHTPPYSGYLERGPDRIYKGRAIRLDLAGYGGAVELGFEGCTMAERPDDYAAFIVRACNSHAPLVGFVAGFLAGTIKGNIRDAARAALASAKL